MAYIDENKFRENLVLDPFGYTDIVKINIALERSTTDDAGVKHGKWAHIGGDEWCCTSCGEILTTEGSWDVPRKKYCYECGAQMDIKSKEI